MRKVLIMIVFSITLMGFKTKSELLDIAEVLTEVESNNNTEAVGDSGKALGILQIHQACVTDVNKWYGTEYTHEDTKNRAIARDIFVKYLSLGIKLYEEKCGHKPTESQIVRMWNGGIYRGHEYPSTLKYLNKYKKQKQLILVDK